MSADLQIITQSAVPPMAPRDFVGRYRGRADMVWAVIFGLIALGLFIIALTGSFGHHLPSYSPDASAPLRVLGLLKREFADIGGVRFLFYFLALCMYGFYRIARGSARAAGKQSNWLVQAGPGGVYIKYRSYLNHHFDADEPAVLFVPGHMVDWVRGHVRHSWKLRSRDDVGTASVEQGRKQYFIEIRLRKGADLNMIGEALQAERNHDAVGEGVVKGKSLHFPARLMPSGILRLDWAGVSPRMKPALAALDRWYTLETTMQSSEEPRDAMSQEALEDKLLELVAEGEVISANRLAREMYGFDTTQAKSFIEDMLSNVPAVPDDPAR